MRVARACRSSRRDPACRLPAAATPSADPQRRLAGRRSRPEPRRPPGHRARPGPGACSVPFPARPLRCRNPARLDAQRRAGRPRRAPADRWRTPPGAARLRGCIRTVSDDRPRSVSRRPPGWSHPASVSRRRRRCRPAPRAADPERPRDRSMPPSPHEWSLVKLKPADSTASTRQLISVGGTWPPRVPVFVGPMIEPKLMKPSPAAEAAGNRSRVVEHGRVDEAELARGEQPSSDSLGGVAGDRWSS